MNKKQLEEKLIEDNTKIVTLMLVVEFLNKDMEEAIQRHPEDRVGLDIVTIERIRQNLLDGIEEFDEVRMETFDQIQEIEKENKNV